MGTRSRIGVMHGDKVKSIYCHWDGYLEHNGRILFDHYNSAKANKLVALGAMSSLRPELGEKHHFDDRNEGCTFYGRDRGEKDVEFKVAHTFEEFLEQCEESGAEYYYIMKDDVWYCGDMYNNIFEGTSISRDLTPLDDALEKVVA